MRRRVADRKGFGVKKGKGICAKEWSTEDGDNPVAS